MIEHMCIFHKEAETSFVGNLHRFYRTDPLNNMYAIDLSTKHYSEERL